MNNTKTPKQRILAIDILRGITIAGMIMVNNPGSWSHMYAPLRHAQFNGLTPTDLVFPFFMFVMGMCTFISMQKFDFQYSAPVARKIIKRTVLIYLVGIAISWFSRFCYRWADPVEGYTFFQQLWHSVWSFDTIRLTGVLARLAVCYGITAFIAITVKHKHIPYIIVTLLIGYFVILLFGNGFEYNETNLLSRFDKAVLTDAHMYHDHGIDPEGIISTLGAIAHTLLGFYVGRMLFLNKQNGTDADSLKLTKILPLFIVGTLLMFAGFLLSYGCPINKKVWSPTFVLVTCGMASGLLALLIWIIDVKGHKKWSVFFEAFGVNPLFLYVLSDVLAILMGSISFPAAEGSVSISGFLYGQVFTPLFGLTGGSFAYSVFFILLNWIFAYRLYKRKIYIKL